MIDLCVKQIIKISSYFYIKKSVNQIIRFTLSSGETGSITYHFKQYHKLVIYC